VIWNGTGTTHGTTQGRSLRGQYDFWLQGCIQYDVLKGCGCAGWRYRVETFKQILLNLATRVDDAKGTIEFLAAPEAVMIVYGQATQEFFTL
jgi:hypothetical protein